MAAVTTPFEPPLTRDVARQALLRHLEGLEVGSRLPPIKDLARELGVGQSALHQTMRDLAREGAVYSKPKLGTFVARPAQVSIPAPGADASAPASASSPATGAAASLKG